MTDKKFTLENFLNDILGLFRAKKYVCQKKKFFCLDCKYFF